MKLYEGMFLIEAGRVAKDWDGTEAEIFAVLNKHGATVKQSHRYDERKLAYPVKKARRGAYLLAYFEADPDVMQEMRVDIELCEAVLRNLVLRVEGDQVPEAPMLGNVEPNEAVEDAAAPAGPRAMAAVEDEEDEEDVDEEEEK